MIKIERAEIEDLVGGGFQDQKSWFQNFGKIASF